MQSRTNYAPDCQPRHGFTLIELLVVVSIIALLVSILIPALSKARNQAKRVYCLSNVKSQYLVQTMYAMDNDDHFAIHNDYMPEFARSAGLGNSVYDVMYSYLDNTRIMECPLLDKFGNWFTVDYFDPLWSGWGGWDSVRLYPNETINNIGSGYMWLANFKSVYADPPVSPIFEFPMPNGMQVSGPAWPKRMTECSAAQAFIAHRITFYSNGLYHDESHGGSLDFLPGDIDTFLGSDDNPVGFADGHVDIVPKFEIQPHAMLEAPHPGGNRTYFYY